MSAIEKLARKDKAEDLAQNPEQQEIKGPTLTEILADKAKSDLFGDYLNMEGDEGAELGMKLKGGDASQLGRDEITLLNEKRRGFLEITERSKNTIAILDLATLKKIAEATPELKDLAETAGPDVLRKAIAGYLPRMAIRDRDRFAVLSEGAAALTERRKIMAEADKEVAKLCKEYDVSEDEYIEILQKGDREGLGELVKGKMSFLKRMFTRARTIEKEIDSLDKAAELRGHIDGLNEDMRNVGSALEITVMENDIIRQAMLTGMTKEGEAEKLEAGMAFSEVKRPKKEDVEKSWKEFGDEYATAHGGLRPELDPDHYDEAVKEFSHGYTSKAMKGKKGFWASISEALWSPMIKNMIK